MTRPSPHNARLRAVLWIYVVVACGAWAWQFVDLMRSVGRLVGLR